MPIMGRQKKNPATPSSGVPALTRPDLSLCIIFRDEQTMLPDFIASVEGLWDELIAVDTGSTDRSADLLRAAGARVTEFSWRDDFAAARNASLEPATGAGSSSWTRMNAPPLNSRGKSTSFWRIRGPEPPPW